MFAAVTPESGDPELWLKCLDQWTGGDTELQDYLRQVAGYCLTGSTREHALLWGHGILSMTCLFKPNGGLQNPVTGNAVSGGIFGPVAGPVTGASITGVDYTGRDFRYGFARPVARENYALAATVNLSAVQAISGNRVLGRGPGAFRSTLWAAGRTRVEWIAVGDAIGAAVQWQSGGLTLHRSIGQASREARVFALGRMAPGAVWNAQLGRAFLGC